MSTFKYCLFITIRLISQLISTIVIRFSGRRQRTLLFAAVFRQRLLVGISDPLSGATEHGVQPVRPAVRRHVLRRKTGHQVARSVDPQSK